MTNEQCEHLLRGLWDGMRSDCPWCEVERLRAEVATLRANAINELGLNNERQVAGSSDEPGVGVSFDEHDRYKRCLYRVNGRLIQLGQEPEKLDYPSTDKCGIAATSGDDVLTPDPTTRPECRTGGVSALPPAQGASRDASSTYRGYPDGTCQECGQVLGDHVCPTSRT